MNCERIESVIGVEISGNWDKLDDFQSENNMPILGATACFFAYELEKDYGLIMDTSDNSIYLLVQGEDEFNRLKSAVENLPDNLNFSIETFEPSPGRFGDGDHDVILLKDPDEEGWYWVE